MQNLFTTIPLNKTINVAVDSILKHIPNFTINKTDLKKLFSITTSKTNFLFNNSIYDQINGIAMGSPPAPISVNLSMGFHEESWLKKYKDSVV